MGFLWIKAHEEIQPKLFELGYSWYKGKRYYQVWRMFRFELSKRRRDYTLSREFEDHLEMKELLIER